MIATDACEELLLYKGTLQSSEKKNVRSDQSSLSFQVGNCHRQLIGINVNIVNIYACIHVKPEGEGTPGICGAFDLYCLPHPREFD